MAHDKNRGAPKRWLSASGDASANRPDPQPPLWIASSYGASAKAAIALGLLKQALAQGMARGFVLTDAGLRVRYGVSRGGDGARPALRHGLLADLERLDGGRAALGANQTPARQGPA